MLHLKYGQNLLDKLGKLQGLFQANERKWYEKLTGKVMKNA